MNFIITGFGRSGTKFLSTMMNKSPTWTVLHEPRSGNDEYLFRNKHRISPIKIHSLKNEYRYKLINTFMNNNRYGEVNSRLRFWIGQIPNVKYGIILRNPADILLSALNRSNEKKTIELISEINFFWHKFHDILLEHPQCIRIDFDKMTTDLSYLNNIFNTFGIYDVDVNSIDLNIKINKNRIVRYSCFDELPKNIKNKWNSLQW